MTAYETIRFATDARGVATLTLARPDKHNALSAEMMRELTHAAREIATNDAIRVAVLTGEGESFCAGGDLNWMRAQFTASRAERIAAARELADMLSALNLLPKPLIGRVQGQAFGGGVGMMAVCDAVLAVGGVRFGLTETRLGLIPATIGPYVVARTGEGPIRRYFMSARFFTAEEAQRLGLISEIVTPETLDAAVEAEIKPYLAAAPGAIAAAKASARSLGTVIDQAVIETTLEHIADRWESAEAQEGVTAFFDKRKPSWRAE